MRCALTGISFIKERCFFKTRPDSSELKLAEQVYRVLGNEFVFVDSDGGESTESEWAFGMRGLGIAPDWLSSLVRREPEEEKYEMLFLFRLEDIENYFGCSAELHEIVPSAANKEDLELIKTICAGARRGLCEFERDGHSSNNENDASLSADTEQEALDEALQELDTLIGLDSVKEQIHNIVKIVQNRGADSLPCMHMVFTGNPGTGKTKIARILARILQALGVLKTDRFIETDRSGLVARYVGHTALKTKEIIKSVQGGMLFIDEAYSLGCYGNLDEGLRSKGRGRDFGPEAIDALVKEMEDSDFICVMAGYPHEMETMISCNPGLRDRVGFYIDFPDYSDNELCEIFDYMLADRNYEATEDAKDSAYEWLQKVCANNDRDFGNARLVRRFVDRVIFKQNVRTAGECIDAVDVDAAIADSDLAKLSDAVLGSSASHPVGFVVA